MTNEIQMTDEAKGRWHPDSSLAIYKRIVVEGTLTLQTPVHFGNGEQEGFELVLVQDALTGNRPLLAGASLAGALRHHVSQRQHGYRMPEIDKSTVQMLFGYALSENDIQHSRVIINDSYSEKNTTTEIRDGVKIDGKTRTADDGKLFQTQTWAVGTQFPLRFELIITADEDKSNNSKEAELITAFATALDALGSGEIPMGARKNRGYGRCTVNDWRVRIYHMDDINDVLAWVANGDDALDSQPNKNILAMFGCEKMTTDKREFVRFDLHLNLCDSLLIRQESADSELVTHLATADKTLIVSGTSIAGALRARAYAIANTVNPAQASYLVDDLFGKFGGDEDVDKQDISASRVLVQEHGITRNNNSLMQHDDDFVQDRVKIDRFTGGAFESALFKQAPVFAIGDTQLKIIFDFRYHDLKHDSRAQAQMGLLLLVLKDLWTQDLPLGGESSVGRGRLQGTSGEICFNQGETITLTSNGVEGNTSAEILDTLENYVTALNTYVEGKTNDR